MTQTFDTIEAPPAYERALAFFTSATILSAGFFITLGLAFVFFGQDYRLGELRSMGPGMFPVAGGVLLAVLGGLIAFSWRPDAEPVEPVALRPLVGILAAVVAFALLVETAGLAIAGPVLIGGALIATGQGTFRAGLVLSVVLTLSASIIFPTLLGVPLKVFP